MSLNLNTEFIVWIIITAIAAIGFIVWISRQLIEQAGPKVGWGLIFIRISATGLLLVILCEPATRLLLNRSEPANVILLVDTSESMNLIDRSGSRKDVLDQFLRSEVLETINEKYHLQTYQFSEQLSPFIVTALDSLPLHKNGTDIGSALEFIKTRDRLDSLSGVILVTDGNYTVGRDPLRVADDLRIPIYTIGIGDTLGVHDLGISSHLTNDVAFVESKVPIEVSIKSQGISQVRVPITLREGGLPLDTQYVTLIGQGREQSVVLHVVPTTKGVHQYTVDVPVQAGEVTSENNHRTFSIKVLKTKLRILYIEGGPRPDLTFLKRTLQRDTNLEVSSIILRPDGSSFPGALPSSRSEWFSYDLIILGSIDAARLQNQANFIAAFVEEKGGGLIALGGPHSFDLGGYAGTPIGNLMPVRIPSTARGLLESPFLPLLTPDGQVHPLTKLHSDPTLSKQRWSELPPLPGINQVGPAKPGAVVLATHPTWQVGTQNAPVITVHRYGLGKVMAITTHEMWRWDLMMWGTGGTNASYEKFWNNAVRWLTIRDGSRRVRVASEKLQYRSGEMINFNGQVYDENYQPVDGANIAVTIQGKQENSQPVQISLTPSRQGNGRYKGELRYLPVGEYTTSINATLNGASLGTDAGGFTIGEASIEFDQTKMNQPFLTQLSAMTGGQFYFVEDSDQLTSDLSFPDITTQQTQDIQLWNHPVVLFLFILLLTAEWLLRRRYGLL
jgi:uncharacterized membrane protein